MSFLETHECDPLLVVGTHGEAAEVREVLECNTHVKGKAYRICCEVECMVGKELKDDDKVSAFMESENVRIYLNKTKESCLQKWFQDKKHVPKDFGT